MWRASSLLGCLLAQTCLVSHASDVCSSEATNRGYGPGNALCSSKDFGKLLASMGRGVRA